MERLSRQECERIRIAFYHSVKEHDGFRECSVRYNPSEGNWIHLGVADVTLDWIPEEFEGIPVWAEEVAQAYNAILPLPPRP